MQQVPTNFDAENADNFEDIEKQFDFAVKAVQHTETFWAVSEHQQTVGRDCASKDSFTSMMPSTSTAPTSVCVGSEAEIPIDIVFTNVPALFHCLDAIAKSNTDVDSVAVANIAPSDYVAIDEECHARGRKTRLFFLAEHKLLIITIPNGPHEKSHLALYHSIEKQINQMGLDRAWTASGATRFLPSRDASSSSTSQGEGDSSGGPWPGRGAELSWPTIVIGGGVSQSLASLRAKMRFWFAQSAHDVKIVLLVKAFPEDTTQKRVLIEQWQERNVPAASARPGATATRLSALSPSVTLLPPVCVQTINIAWAVQGVAYDEASRDQQRDPRSFNVVRGPLRLEFSRLFLRQPAGPHEQDIVLADDDLQWCALQIWYR